MEFLKKLLIVDKILFLWGFSLLLIIITFLIVHYKITSHSLPVALHYNVIVGVDLFGAKGNLYKIPLIGLFFWVVNLALSRFIRTESSFLSFMAAFLTALICLVLLASTLFLLKVN